MAGSVYNGCILEKGDIEMIKAVLYDLDGTLLPMDQDKFTGGYFKFLVKKMAPHGYEPQKLIDTIWAGTAAMVKNDREMTNEEAFWKKFSEIWGSEKVLSDKALFEEFYSVDFQCAKDFCGYNEKAAFAVRQAKELGFRVALATNPIFPEYATKSRIRWAGLDYSDFEFFTSYENVNCCKPNLNYYREVAERIGLEPQECLMVGNDVDEDMIAEKIGMKVFLITDCMINRGNKDISVYPHGSFDELVAFLKNLKAES